MKAAAVQFSIRIPRKLRQRTKRAARRQGLTMTEFGQRALEQATAEKHDPA